MQFDTAIAAQNAFKRVQQNGELDEDLDRAIEAEEAFSSTAGEESASAYQTMLMIGERHPEATAFQEFLIYITWNHVMDHPTPGRFKKGVELCNRYLKKIPDKKDETEVKQVLELRKSFLNGLGLGSSDEEEYEEDTFKGGD